MKIVFHEDFKCTDYASNGASVTGRMEVIITALVKEGRYEVVSPEPALYEDLARAHSRTHIADIAKDARLFKMASLAAGGAILASEIAFKEADICVYPAARASCIEEFYLGILCFLQYGYRNPEIERKRAYRKRVCIRL